jgi:hypothetical protein
MSGNGGIIIRRNAIQAATAGTVTDNLTPAECACRDAIIAKGDGDFCLKDLKTLHKLVETAYSRVA